MRNLALVRVRGCSSAQLQLADTRLTFVRLQPLAYLWRERRCAAPGLPENARSKSLHNMATGCNNCILLIGYLQLYLYEIQLYLYEIQQRITG